MKAVATNAAGFLTHSNTVFSMKKYFFLSLLAWGQLTFAQTEVWHLAATLDSLLFPEGTHTETPGFAVCVVDQGRIVYERQTGLANVKARRPITAETMFNLGSVSKQFTAACILLLEEQGKLNRSDDIRKYVPEIPSFGENTITLHHLLAHTSGLHDHLEVQILQNKYNRKRICTERTLLKFLQRGVSLAFPPGTDHAYCNTGYMLLNMVVERVSGMKMQDFAEQNIFKPLGMAHSSFQYDEAAALTDGTASYSFKAKNGRFSETKRDYNAMGATGVHGTLRDLVLWDQNFYHNRLGKGDQALMERMETPYRLNNGSSAHYGAGLFVRKYRGIPVVDHSGGWNSFLVQHRRFEGLGISVMVASNNDHTSPFPIYDKICDKILKFSPLVENFDARMSNFPLPISSLEGSYLSANNRLRHLRMVNDTLKILIPSGAKERGIALSFCPERSMESALFFVDELGDTVQFRLGAGQQVSRFLWEGGDYFRCFREYKKLEPPANSALRQWAGKYRSAELGQAVRVKFRKKAGGRLRVYPVFFKGYDLVPLGSGAFSVKGEPIVVRFSPEGLAVGHYWLQNLQLARVK